MQTTGKNRLNEKAEAETSSVYIVVSAKKKIFFLVSQSRSCTKKNFFDSTKSKLHE